jgi:hypothetical protein
VEAVTTRRTTESASLKRIAAPGTESFEATNPAKSKKPLVDATTPVRLSVLNP